MKKGAAFQKLCIGIRSEFIRRRNRIKNSLSIIGFLIPIVASMLLLLLPDNLSIMFRPWAALSLLITVIAVFSGYALVSNLPNDPIPTADSTAETVLTTAVIARDSFKKQRSSFASISIGFMALVIWGTLALAHGLEYAFSVLWAFIIFWALCIFFIVRAQRKADKLRNALMNGDFHLICSPLNDKEEEENSATDPITYSWHFYFNRHPEHGQYTLTTTSGDFRRAEIGEDFYVVLRKDKYGVMKAIHAYRAAKFFPDIQLQDYLKRDAELCGEPISSAELALKTPVQNFVLMKYTPEQEAAALPKAQAQSKKAVRYGIIATVSTLFFSMLLPVLYTIEQNMAESLLTANKIAWYWKLLVTLSYPALCFGSYWLCIKHFIHSHEEFSHMTNHRRKRWHTVQFIIHTIITWICVIWCVLWILTLWGIMD